MTRYLPVFTGSRSAVLEQTMHWVHEHIGRRLPDEQWIQERFLRRTVGEILDDGFTLAYAPCVDRTLVTSAILGRHGMGIHLVLQDLPNGTWHLIMEIPLEDGSWMWGDYGNRESRLYPGRFQYGRIEGKSPRLLCVKGPKFTPKIWDSRPPLRLLAGMGVDLFGRFQRFHEELGSYREEVRAETYSLDDRLVRDWRESVYADLWRTHTVVRLGEPGVDYADLSGMHLYLERPASTRSAS